MVFHFLNGGFSDALEGKFVSFRFFFLLLTPG